MENQMAKLIKYDWFPNLANISEFKFAYLFP